MGVLFSRFSVSLMVAVCLTGCAFQGTQQTCATGALSTSTQGDAKFTLVASNPNLTIYPGQTEQMSVQVMPVNGSTGTVNLTGAALPQGISIAPVSAPIGSTALLTISATNNVVASCFTGIRDVFTAGTAVTVQGTAGTSSVAAQMPLTVVLENPSFTPATTNLPVMNIVTAAAAPILNTDNYVTATLTITDPVTKANNYTGTMGIKGHGNSSWEEPKKPYRLNLDSKAALLGMTSDTNWILLANYDDKAMLRTDVSFTMSEMFGMAWTPNTAFTEVYLNGVYEGTYQLSEKVEVSKARLDIGSIDDTDNSGTDLTGGYIGEIDHYYNETFMFPSPIAKLPIGIADPDPPTGEQSTYFVQAFDPAEASMYQANPDAWVGVWDQNSLVDWFLVEELAGNEDSNDFSSDYFYKPRGDTLFYRGPVWDMNITFGNNNEGPVGNPGVVWVPLHSDWYVQLFRDPVFVAAVKARWAVVRTQAYTLPAYLDTRGTTLSLAATNNYQRWPTLGEVIWPNLVAEGTYPGEVAFMKSWLNLRLAYMDAHYLP